MMEHHFHRYFPLRDRSEIEGRSGIDRAKPHGAHAGSRDELRNGIDIV